MARQEDPHSNSIDGAPGQLVRKKMPELDALRGVAILAVVFYHGLFWSNNLNNLSGLARIAVNFTRFGWLGVNLFFVLSGFLITGILLNRKEAKDYYRQFYFRRAVRILPALYALLLVLCLIPRQSYRYILLSFFFCANLATLFHVPYPYAVLWSLSVEEHYYLLWPSAIRLLNRRCIYACCAILLISAPIFRALAFRHPLPEGFGSFTWQTWDGIAAGAVLALLVRESWMTRSRLAGISWSSIAVALFALAAGAPVGVLSRMEKCGAVFMLSIINLFFFGVLGLAVFCGSATQRWPAIWNIPRFYGAISYGLYLYHLLVFMLFDQLAARFWPTAHASSSTAVFLFVRFAMVLVVATILAFVSRWTFEEKFLRLTLPANRDAG